MAQKLTFYPIGNAETCLLELGSGAKLLFDYAAEYDGTDSDKRYDIKKELLSINEFDVVMFSHAHDDHTKGASDFFYLDHAAKYQSDTRAKIKELWVSAAFLLDTDLENQSDAKILRNEARYRLKNKYGIKVFAAPDSLKTSLESQGIDYEDVKGLIVHAGQIVELPATIQDELQVFVHAPFSDDSEDVQNKNDPSIVLQLRLYNARRETNVLITGDTPYQVLDKIVDISQTNGNEEYLCWDIYDIPHHCSHTGLNKKDQDVKVLTPTENVQWLLKKAATRAYMVASCVEITEETSPPHMCAKRGYETYTGSGVEFLATMEHIPTGGNGHPTPIQFSVDSMGVTLKSNNLNTAYFGKSAPRAGK
jgi:hypothetical protein